MEGKGGGENGTLGQVGKTEGEWVKVRAGRGETGEERGAGEGELICRYEGCGKCWVGNYLMTIEI